MTSWLNMIDSWVRRLLSSEIVRYGLMATILVMIELGLFVLLNSVMGLSYLIATPTSTLMIIIMNWYGSQRFVFHNRVHSKRKEFTLVAGVSLIGIGIQTAVAAIMVSGLGALPIIGKIFAILATFAWNFWTRRRFIFPTQAQD